MLLRSTKDLEASRFSLRSAIKAKQEKETKTQEDANMNRCVALGTLEGKVMKLFLKKSMLQHGAYITAANTQKVVHAERFVAPNSLLSRSELKPQTVVTVGSGTKKLTCFV
jgi:hypothetical protein